MKVETNTGRIDRRRLAARALVRLVAGFVVLLAMFLLPAGTTSYWQAWVYMAVLFVPMTSVFLYLLRHDPELLERRMRLKEKEPQQRLFIKLGSICYLVIFLLPGFDHRFGWSAVPVAAVVLADILVLLGYGLFLMVLRENRYASHVVEVEEGQHVVATGPYAIVRHPMYAAIIVMFFATPVALGSWWAVLPAALLIPLLVVRIRNEEAVLERELAGYVEYTHRTVYRLVPGVW